MSEPVDEELWQPPARRDGRWLLLIVALAAVVGGIAVLTHDDDGERPVAVSTDVTPTRRPDPPAASTAVVLGPPSPLVDAVREVFPRARLSALGLEVTADPDPARNYQFATTRRRITVVVGPTDDRPGIVRTDLRTVVVVRTDGGHRVAVTVQAISGRVATGDEGAARRLARDARLLAVS